MMRRISRPSLNGLTSFALATLLVAFVAGCAGNTEPVEETTSTTGSEFEDAPAPPPPPPVRETRISAANLRISPVYFDFDDARIKPEFAPILEKAAAALRETGASVTIEGHCDERGSDEYNLALGERRANAVRNYLYNLGVPQEQMTTISYGEARPAVRGTGEAVWRLNRRAEFVIR